MNYLFASNEVGEQENGLSKSGGGLATAPKMAKNKYRLLHQTYANYKHMTTHSLIVIQMLEYEGLQYPKIRISQPWAATTENVHWDVCPAKTQIRLRIRAVWSEFSLGAYWIAKDVRFFPAENEDSDQTARILRLIWVLVGRTCQKVRFLTLRLIVLL